MNMVSILWSWSATLHTSPSWNTSRRHPSAAQSLAASTQHQTWMPPLWLPWSPLTILFTQCTLLLQRSQKSSVQWCSQPAPVKIGPTFTVVAICWCHQNWWKWQGGSATWDEQLHIDLAWSVGGSLAICGWGHGWNEKTWKILWLQESPYTPRPQGTYSKLWCTSLEARLGFESLIQCLGYEEVN